MRGLYVCQRSFAVNSAVGIRLVYKVPPAVRLVLVLVTSRSMSRPSLRPSGLLHPFRTKRKWENTSMITFHDQFKPEAIAALLIQQCPL